MSVFNESCTSAPREVGIPKRWVFSAKHIQARNARTQPKRLKRTHIGECKTVENKISRVFSPKTNHPTITLLLDEDENF